MIQIKNLSVYFQDLCLLKSINLTIEKGQFYCLVGESGGGKSLLSKAILGTLPETMRTHGFIQRESEKLDFILQNPRGSLQSQVTIKRQVYHLLNSYGYPKKDWEGLIYKMLASVQLDHHKNLLDKTPLQLSGGMCQKLALACALFSKPDFLVADEVTSALDQESRQEILDLIYKFYQDNQVTLLCITHDLDVAEKYASHLGIIHQGALIESGEKRKILAHPQKTYTKELIQSFEEHKSFIKSGKPI